MRREAQGTPGFSRLGSTAESRAGPGPESGELRGSLDAQSGDVPEPVAGGTRGGVCACGWCARAACTCSGALGRA